MKPRTAQDWVDLVIEAGGQQWLLRLVAVVAPIGAVLATSAAEGALWVPGVLLVAGFATASAFAPDTHLSLTVIAIVVWRWLAVTDDVATGWLPVAAVCLLVFHTTIALASTVPLGAVIPLSVLARWAVRTAAVGGVTVVIWGMVAVLDRRDAPGNAVLTGAALAVVALIAVAIRGRSMPGRVQGPSGS